MKPRINFIALGVNDVPAAAAFYRALGWESTDMAGDGVGSSGTNVAFFALQNGLILGLIPRDELVKEAQIAPGEPSPSELSLDYNVDSKEGVNEVMSRVEAAGATITSQPTERAWGGYSGYFTDPGGHLWAVVYNPRLQVG